MDIIKLPFQIAILVMREIFSLMAEGVAESQIARNSLDNETRNADLAKLGITRVNGQLVFPDYSKTK